jgi:phenylacetate-coenzyme A ligase PaaK-like adenylate-forming protein
MNYFKSFQEDILNLNIKNFEEKALELFFHQARYNIVYSDYIKYRGIAISSIKNIEDIPFLPIKFFKDFPVVTGEMASFQGYFSSSGTTGAITSKHYFWSEEFYLHHSLNLFEKEYGSITDYHILALLPSYLERKGSSLVRMAEYFIQKTGSEFSGFYLYNHEDLIKTMEVLKKDEKKVILLGVTFALLDLADGKLNIPLFDNLKVMETGGMKGRRREMIREEVHAILKRAFGVNHIHSEYGMTELMSQAYSKSEGKYNIPFSMRVMVRDINDPLSYSNRKQGGINIIDLANFHSCAFIETQDLGQIDRQNKLEVLGRFDNSEVRGCNLMVN